MKKSVITLIVILVVLLALPIYSFIKWSIQPKRPISVLVLDKTVPSLERNQHRSLFTLMTQHRFVNKENKGYSFRKDYFGFFPLKPLRNKQYNVERIRLTDILQYADSYDGAYYADTYGVYFNDWYKGISKGRRSRMIYGGLNNNDYLLLKEMNDRHKLIIAEYNILGYPTAGLERNKTEEIFKVRWTEWTGKYFFSLDTIKSPDIPKWILENYREQYRQPWDFHKSGIVFVSDGGKVVVLENETHLDFDIPYIYTSSQAMKDYGLPYKVAYSNWFNIVESAQNDILSYFKIHVNELGDSIMQAHFIPTMFPAVLKSSDEHNYYFFAGDFANNPVKNITGYFKNFKNLNLYRLSNEKKSTRKFYYEYYDPLMNNIYSKYLEKVKPAAPVTPEAKK
jgi:hypothetical protein